MSKSTGAIWVEVLVDLLNLTYRGRSIRDYNRNLGTFDTLEVNSTSITFGTIFIFFKPRKKSKVFIRGSEYPSPLLKKVF